VRRQPDSRLSLLFEVFAAARGVGELVAAALVDAPLTPEEYAVYSVLFDEGPHGPTELARRCGMPATSMTHFVRAMTARGHAERAASAEDRRSYRIVLTAAGLAAHAETSLAFAAAEERFAEALLVDDDAARAALRAIGQAAATGRARLLSDAIDETA
jgi:DNA-binding MarR family transcriptional regulator